MANKICTMANSKKINGLHFTTNHTGKMSGMASISTSVCMNERCKKNASVPGSICSKCYAATMARRFPGMDAPLAQNQRILTGSVLPEELLPVINVLYFRFEAFGDLNNDIQVINYFNICKKNPSVRFALWTKNPDYIAKAIKDGHEKPENLNIILSSLFINKEGKTRYEFIDKIFTVYDPAYINEHNIEINCGARNCFECGLCYNKNDVRIINEKLK
jgi:protein gp37